MSALLGALVAALCPAASAEPAELRTTHQVGVALFPEGAQYIFEAEARFPLWDSDHVLLQDAHVAVIGHAEITPSFPRGGPVLRIAPLAIWDITLRAYGTWYFGAFSSLLPFDDPAFQATKQNKRELISDGARTGGWGVRFDAETRLKGKAGPVIAMLELQYRRHEVQSYEGDLAWFWEPTEMINVAATGEVINRNVYLFYEVKKPRPATDLDPGNDAKLWLGAVGFWQTSPQSGDRNIRLGPVAFWKPGNGPSWPTIIVGAQPWIDSSFAPTFPPYTFAAASWSR